MHLRHGKGDKQRDIAIVEDSANTAVNALREWKNALFQQASHDRTYIFCAVGKGNRIGVDEPVSSVAINQLITKTAQLAGVDFRPHDARRTLGTDLLSNGNSVSDVQAQLGHAHANTTIQSYALPADAKKRRGRFHISY